MSQGQSFARRIGQVLVVALVAGLVPCSAAWAKDKPSAPPPPGPQGTQPAPSPGSSSAVGADGLALRSNIGGFNFGERPLALRDDGTLSGIAGMVAREQGRVCGGGEAFGWEAKADDQTRIDRIQSAVDGALRQNGYKLSSYTSRAVRSEDVVIYNADKVSGRLLLLWVLSPAASPDAKTQLVMILCKAEKS